MNVKYPTSQTPSSTDSSIDAKKAELAAARARLDDSLHEFSENTRSMLWRVALPFACGALVSGVALWLLKSRKPRSFALVQFVTQPPPKPAAAPGLVSAAWGAGARVVLPQLIELLTNPKRGPEEDETDQTPVAH